jgi:uncharacterized membrane protein YgcG
MFQVQVFWVVTPCSVVVGYQCFGGPYCFHLQGEVAVRTSDTLVSYHNTTECHNTEGLDLKLNCISRCIHLFPELLELILVYFKLIFWKEWKIKKYSDMWGVIVLPELTMNSVIIMNNFMCCCYSFVLRKLRAVGIALGYGLDDWGCRVRFPAGAGNFSLHHRVKTGSGAHPASYPTGTGGSYSGGKAAGAWSWPFTSI